MFVMKNALSLNLPKMELCTILLITDAPVLCSLMQRQFVKPRGYQNDKLLFHGMKYQVYVWKYQSIFFTILTRYAPVTILFSIKGANVWRVRMYIVFTAKRFDRVMHVSFFPLNKFKAISCFLIGIYGTPREKKKKKKKPVSFFLSLQVASRKDLLCSLLIYNWKGKA